MVLQAPVSEYPFILSSADEGIPIFPELGTQRRAGKMAQWVKEPAAKPDNLSFNSGNHRVEGANWLPQAGLCP